MTLHRKLLLAIGAAALATSPALADGFSFGFSYNKGPRYYRPYSSTYVYRDYAPIYYSDCAPVVVAPAPVYYAPPVVYPRPVYRSYYYPRAYYGHSYRYYGHHHHRPVPHASHYGRVHARWR
jgi:hypothetical protein